MQKLFLVKNNATFKISYTILLVLFKFRDLLQKLALLHNLCVMSAHCSDFSAWLKLRPTSYIISYLSDG